MLTDANEILGAAINVLDYRLGQSTNDLDGILTLPSEGYLITSGSDNFVDASGNKFVWADRV